MPESMADDDSQFTLAEVERRASSATGVRESTSRRGTGLDLTSKASLVRILPRIWLSQKFTVAVVPVMGLDDKKIVQIACGQQHSIALDEEGYAHGVILRCGLIIFSNAELYTSGATMAIAVWALGIRRTF
jgi:hypothetical protein